MTLIINEILSLMELNDDNFVAERLERNRDYIRSQETNILCKQCPTIITRPENLIILNDENYHVECFRLAYSNVRSKVCYKDTREYIDRLFKLI